MPVRKVRVVPEPDPPRKEMQLVLQYLTWALSRCLCALYPDATRVVVTVYVSSCTSSTRAEYAPEEKGKKHEPESRG
jgi:hypothetical protein